jgi:predicted negative regulator of RcsB-dependent stress response
MVVTKGGLFGWRFQQQKQRAQAQHATREQTTMTAMMALDMPVELLQEQLLALKLQC